MKAIALISGGLDSILAARLVKEQGIEVVPLCFQIPFCHSDKHKSPEVKDKFGLVKDALGLELETADIADEFLKLLEKPRYGFGSNMNPCIDCKILMFCRAKELMEGQSARFIVTGEVLGQRPMSQHRQALELIEKKSGLSGLLLRPLSAKLLQETIPEREGWVDRSKLLDYNGRSRKRQIELAEKFNIRGYPNAGGGCLLTDPEFSGRLKELMQHKELSPDNVKLLKVGRHFRLSDCAKLIVGRNEQENKELVGLAQERDYLFSSPPDLAGPVALGRGEFTHELIGISSAITCRYCDLGNRTEAGIIYYQKPKDGLNQSQYVFKATPFREDELTSLRI